MRIKKQRKRKIATNRGQDKAVMACRAFVENARLDHCGLTTTNGATRSGRGTRFRSYALAIRNDGSSKGKKNQVDRIAGIEDSLLCIFRLL